MSLKNEQSENRWSILDDNEDPDDGLDEARATVLDQIQGAGLQEDGFNAEIFVDSLK